MLILIKFLLPEHLNLVVPQFEMAFYAKFMYRNSEKSFMHNFEIEQILPPSQ